MKALKTIILVLIIVASASYSVGIFLAGPCGLPRTYRIGVVDAGFGITDADLLLAVREAEALWEGAVGTDLFSFDLKGELPINLRYDDRQETSQRNRVLETRIDSTERTAETVKREFESLTRLYEAAQRDYGEMKSAYESDQSDYNAEISRWNAQGGAPKERFDALSRERAALEASFAALETKRSEVNRLATEINASIQKYNYLVKTVNSDVEVINSAADKEFEQGQYRREGGIESIDVYEFKDRSDLVRVLAHELGHALDTDHNDNPESLMYHLNTSDNMKPTPEDVSGVRVSCKLD